MAQVQWWDDWQLRVVLLASLTAQYFLVLFAGIRKFHIPPWLRVSFRLAHIGSDALAIFALATLFSRQKNGPRCSYVRGSRELELLWAPIVLMHLGGQVVTTTYKIEDNEQWSRHILTSLSKVTVALYVFYRSWSSDDKRLLIATILLFILVIIRCFQKALDLKSSSFNAIRKNSLSEISFVQGNFVTEEVRTGGYVKRARNIVLGCPEPLEVTHHAYPSLPYQLCLDFPCPYPDRLAILNKFWLLDSESAYRAIEGVLSAMTSFLYTKDDTIPYLALKNAPTSLIFRWCTQVLAYGTLVTVICLVHTSSHKEAYSGRDTRVTLVLLYGTLLLELVYFGVQTAFRDRFSGRILQRSLLGLLDHNRRYPMLRRMAGWLQCKDLVDKYFGHMEPSYSCKEITELIRCHVESGWKNCIVDTKSYRRFNDTRGEGTLASKLCLQKLGWSLKRPFDETIILWHLATDICFRRKDTSPDDHQCAPKCKEISNYMMHLLFHNPEMLMPGSRKSLFSRVYNELESILEGKQAQWDKRDFTRQLIETCDSHHHDDHIFSYISDTRHNPDSSVSDTYIPNSFIRDACLLAENLSCDIGHEIKMWEVIQGVWVEMLCFSASRSRGYLHAETLGTGVEYLSYAWVLLAYAGIETFPEKLQKREDLLFDSGEPSV